MGEILSEHAIQSYSNLIQRVYECKSVLFQEASISENTKKRTLPEYKQKVNNSLRACI